MKQDYFIRNNSIISPNHTLQVQCIYKKWKNFNHDKIYTAISRAKIGDYFTDFQITDNDGDTYTITARDIKINKFCIQRKEP